MKKPWNDSDLARLSADLDEELNSIFDQAEAALGPKEKDAQGDDGGWDDNPGAGRAGEADDADNAASESEPPFIGPAAAGADWLAPEFLGEPELLGEPEASAGPLTPEVVRELRRMIEAAVEKGVAAALAKLKI